PGPETTTLPPGQQCRPPDERRNSARQPLRHAWPVAHDKGLPYPAARHSLGAVVAAGRVGLGLGALAAPRLLLATWIGDEPASGRPQQVLGRALGGRDVALGAVALHAISGGG